MELYALQDAIKLQSYVDSINDIEVETETFSIIIPLRDKLSINTENETIICFSIIKYFISKCIIGHKLEYPPNLEKNDKTNIFIDNFNDYVEHKSLLNILRNDEGIHFALMVGKTEILLIDKEGFTEILSSLINKNLTCNGLLTEYWVMLNKEELKRITTTHDCILIASEVVTSNYTNVVLTIVLLNNVDNDIIRSTESVEGLSDEYEGYLEIL